MTTTTTPTTTPNHRDMSARIIRGFEAIVEEVDGMHPFEILATATIMNVCITTLVDEADHENVRPTLEFGSSIGEAITNDIPDDYAAGFQAIPYDDVDIDAAGKAAKAALIRLADLTYSIQEASAATFCAHYLACKLSAKLDDDAKEIIRRAADRYDLVQSACQGFTVCGGQVEVGTA